jgi:membrane protease subunit HflK
MGIGASSGGGGPFGFNSGSGPKLPKIDLPNINLPKGAARLIVIGLIAVVLLWMSFYQIQPDEVGAVLQFGRFARETNPGPHFLIPIMETVVKVPVQRQLKQEFGFRTVEAGVRTEYSDDRLHLDESVMLTGDLNVGVVEWIVQYKIKDPYAFLFKVRSVESTFRDMSEAAMRQVVGDHSVDEVLTIGRERIAAQAKDLLQNLCDKYETGIDVQQLVLQDVNPPDPVKPSFNEVNQAIQEKERVTNEAWADYNQAIPKARGEAQRVIQESEGYAAERVNRSQGEATRFEAIYQEYRKAPRVTRNRMYLETMDEVLPRLGKKVILDDQQQGVLPLLNLGPGAAVEVKQ